MLGLGLVALPLVKIHVVDRLAIVDRFRTSGERAGWRVSWLLYLGLEVIVAGLCWWSLSPPERAARLSFRSPRLHRWSLALLALAGLTTVLLILRHTGTLDLTARHPATDHLPTSAGNTTERLLLLAGAVLAVICEEVIFRGFAISGLLVRGVSSAWAVVVPALAFGYLHGGVTTVAGAAQTVLVAGAAVGLGLLYRRTRSLLPGAVLHLTWTWLFVVLTPT